MRENAWQRGQLRAVSRSSPKYIVPVESINTFIALASPGSYRVSGLYLIR